MDDRGYSLRVARANEQADPSNIGVLLGRLCIAKEIPAAQVAEFFNVSPMTIYNWFKGLHAPRTEQKEQIQKVIDSLNGKS